jgi:hypothetical protein
MERDPRFFEPPHDTGEDAQVSFEPPSRPGGSPLDEVIERHRSEILALDGVEGIDRSREPDGTEVIRVHLSDASRESRIPRELDGHPVITLLTGPFEAL